MTAGKAAAVVFAAVAPWLLVALGSAAPPVKTAAAQMATLPAEPVPSLNAGPVQLRATGGGATVVAFFSTSCPLSKRYASRLQALSNDFAARGVRFVAVYPNRIESDAEVRTQAKAQGLTVPIVRGADLARRLGATVTPSVWVAGAGGKAVYRGRIDDNTDPSKVSKHFLRDALTATLDGKPAPITLTRATGCAIQGLATRPVPVTTRYTYNRDIAPLLNRRCVSCHRTGQVGPMPLDTWERARAWAGQMTHEVQARRMPPWFAETDADRSPYHDDPSLTPAEKALLADWSRGGTPRGTGQAPPTPKFADGWQLGKPDAVFQMPRPFTVPRDGRDVYRCFVIPTDFAEDRWVSGVEYLPGNRATVHHMSVFLDTSGQAKALEAGAKDGPGYRNPTPGNGPGFDGDAGQLGGWTPGHSPRRLPAGVAIKLPKGANLVLEVHYHPTGEPQTDVSKVALHFAKEPPVKTLHLADVSDATFRIPAGARNYKAEAIAWVPEDITLLSVTPHMHNRGTLMRAIATLPDGTRQTLIDVRRWDFRWQPSYRFKTPVRLPRHTRIDMEARFNNSDANPNNPSRPPREVTWGEATDDEMCTLFLAYTRDDEDLQKDPVIVSAP